MAFCGADLSGRLDDNSTYGTIVNTGKQLASVVANFIGRTLSSGAINVAGVEIVSDGDVVNLRNHLTALRGFGDKLSTFSSQARLKNIPFDLALVTNLIKYRDEMLAIQKLISTAKTLEAKVNYLNMGLQYVAPGTSLYEAMSSAIAKFNDVISSCRANGGNSADVQNYIRELDDVKVKYIDWYLCLYRKYCLNEMDEADKRTLLASDYYRVLNILQDLPICNPAELANIRADLNKLKIADPHVENMLENSPYANFDPRNATSKLKTIHELKNEVMDLFTDWEADIKNFLQDEERQNDLALMEGGAQDFANRLIQGMENLTFENTAKAVVEFIMKLAKGFQRVEISSEDLASTFSRPMTMDQATAYFDRLIANKTRGMDRNKVRIVFTTSTNN